MTARDILDASEIETGIDVGGHPAIEQINDDAAGRRRLVIERTDRSGRIDNHDRQALARRRNRELFGEELRALVGTDHILDPNRSVFASRAAVDDTKRA